VNYEQVRVTRETADEQLKLSRETAIRSVRPHMRVASYVEGPGAGKKTGLYLTNLGLGPATLTKLSIEMGGQTYDLMQPHGQEIAVQAMGLNSLCVVIVAPEPGTVLKVNEEGPLLASTSSPIAPLCALPLMKALDKRDIKVHFGDTSMWDEKIEDSQSIHLDLDEAIGIVQAVIQTALAAPTPAPAGKPSARGGPPSPPTAK